MSNHDGADVKQKEPMVNGEAINEKLVVKLLGSLKGIKFGQVVITVHNEKVVQIDRTEKNRCEFTVWQADGSGI
jgi:hypothetical protein